MNTVPRQLSANEQALVDAFLAGQRAKVIPKGRSSRFRKRDWDAAIRCETPKLKGKAK